MSDNGGSDEELYSYVSSKTVYKRGRSRPSSADLTSHKVYYSTDTDEQDPSEYLPVSRWAVDYNNKNYVRSLCNKNVGLHRKVKGRPKKYKIHYDNNYFTRSKVNAPKGLHRKKPEIKRKYVPDDDVLADATGWEFDYGPEFDQTEQDVHFIPEGRITRRGCYRWYGVKRNDSDCDIKQEEERENLLTEELEEELKYGQEFLQSDIPYMEEQKNRRYTRGGYRFFETLRNVNDFKPEDLDEVTLDPEWRRKHHCNGVRYLDQELCDCERDDAPAHRNHVRKGKPFRRTILNKVYELKKEDSSKDVKRHATRLSLIPGDSRQSLYEGMPDRMRYLPKKSPSIRSVFKKKTEKFKSIREGEEYEEYEKEDTKQSYTELRPVHEDRRVNRVTEVKHGRRHSDEDLTRNGKGSRRFDERTYFVNQEDNDRSKRRHTRIGTGSDEDVRENFETWKENTLYKNEEDDNGYRTVRKKSKERRKEKFYNERDYPLKNNAVERRRNIEKRYDRQEHRSQRPASSSRDRHHGNEIRRQPEIGKVKRKDLHCIDMNLQHIRDRGTCIRTPDNFKPGLIQDKEQVLKKMPPHPRRKSIRNGDNFKPGLIQDKEQVSMRMPPHPRVKSIRNGDNFEAEVIQDKNQALKKMPPHVEERVRDIRKRMEMKLDEAGRKHKDRRDKKAFDSSSSDDEIDLMKHKGHPNDRGETHNSEYEKYVTKNGSEIWVKKNEKYAELHHKNHR